MDADFGGIWCFCHPEETWSPLALVSLNLDLDVDEVFNFLQNNTEDDILKLKCKSIKEVKRHISS